MILLPINIALTQNAWKLTRVSYSIRKDIKLGMHTLHKTYRKYTV